MENRNEHSLSLGENQTRPSVIAIIGGGAAGCFAAANIPFQENRSVLVFEKTGKLLQKVKVSGGGRCNATHHIFDVPALLEKYPRGKQLLKKTLYQFGPRQTIEWFEKRGVQLKAEQDGRMFPVTDSSETIMACLREQMTKNKVEVVYNKTLLAIDKEHQGFLLRFADRSTYKADKVIIACGGYPKEEQYNWIRALGHSVQPPVPSLFTFNLPGHSIRELMGLSVPDVSVKIMGTKISEQGPMLITHWGLSGPVILRASAWGAVVLNQKGYDFHVLVNWLDQMTREELKDRLFEIRRQAGKQLVEAKNPFGLPKRLWEFLLAEIGLAGATRWGELTSSAQNKLMDILVSHTFHVTGKTTFKEEFVTSGGITLSEVNPETMESRIVSGLYFAGEILNADGITGGFNFQHAWSSGWIAARAILHSIASAGQKK